MNISIHSVENIYLLVCILLLVVTMILAADYGRSIVQRKFPREQHNPCYHKDSESYFNNSKYVKEKHRL